MTEWPRRLINLVLRKPDADRKALPHDHRHRRTQRSVGPGQQRWPEVIDRKELLLKLAAEGCAAIEGEEADRGRAVEETAGVLAGVYGPCEFERLRKDWRK